MHARTTLFLALGLAACGREANPTEAELERQPDGFAISGTVYGFTGAPDSQRVAIAGASVAFIRVGDIPEPDTVSVPVPDTLPRCPIEMLCARTAPRGGSFVLDTVISPPGNCSDGDPEATVTTDAAGSFTVAGLTAGVYALRAAPPTGSGWKALEYCSFEVQADWPWPFDVYLTADN